MALRVPIKVKVAAALTVPLALLLAVAAFEVTQASREARLVRDQTDLATATTGPSGVINALQNERNFTGMWLLGSEGIGLLYVSDRVLDRLEPARVGWTSVRDWIEWSRYDLRLREGAGRFECGTLNTFGVHALGASLDLLAEVGIPRIEGHVRGLTDRIVAGLAGRGFEIVSPRGEGEWSGIVAATHPERGPEEIVKALRDRGVIAAHRSGR